ncbi:MAG TPA: hypothetical protein DDZ81_17815 [Acetobacteraceae bacterium]|nr:hypothetical protein [Acetobacteraceae bacterium]
MPIQLRSWPRYQQVMGASRGWLSARGIKDPILPPPNRRGVLYSVETTFRGHPCLNPENP